MWSPLLGLAALATFCAACKPGVTKVSGTAAPSTVCSGQLVFEDQFDELDLDKWQHEITLAGGGNWEFQYYTNNRTNSFARDGRLFIRPSLTADQFGEAFLSSGKLNVDGGTPADRCTNPTSWGCERQGTTNNIINPITSARVRSVESFSFRYGRVEVRARMPAGDWLWPGNFCYLAAADPKRLRHLAIIRRDRPDGVPGQQHRNLLINGANIGTQEAGSTLHYGPYPGLNGWEKAHWTKRDGRGFNSDFHKYQLEWTPDFIKFSIDDVELGRITPGQGGFWELGGFDKGRNISNPWRFGSKMAPFDQKFYIVMNLAVGGTTGYFPDEATNPTPKPWKNGSPTAMRDFWNGRSGWLPTWNLDKNDGQDASLQVDYVRVWAL